MPREILKVDHLVVEGGDDQAFVNAFIRARLGINLADPICRLIKIGKNDRLAIDEFDKRVDEAHVDARIGLIVDRDATGNDNWPAVRARLAKRGWRSNEPSSAGAIVGQFGVWMWPDNLRYGVLEDFIAEILPASALRSYAEEASLVAKSMHGAEYDEADARKAPLKVRSIWRDAGAAGGYGHLIRAGDELTETPALVAFLAWFRALFLE